MNSILLNHKINSFMKRKEDEIPELTQPVDRLYEDLVGEDDRLSRVY